MLPPLQTFPISLIAESMTVLERTRDTAVDDANKCREALQHPRQSPQVGARINHHQTKHGEEEMQSQVPSFSY